MPPTMIYSYAIAEFLLPIRYSRDCFQQMINILKMPQEFQKPADAKTNQIGSEYSFKMSNIRPTLGIKRTDQERSTTKS